jgi:hypothetical protein
VSAERPELQATAVVHVSHHQLLVLDDEAGPVVPTSSEYNGIVATKPGAACVWTGVHTGPVEVTVGIYGGEPEYLDVSDRWDEVVDATLHVEQGPVRVMGLMGHQPEALRFPPVTAGLHRMRVHARGRDSATEQAPPAPTELYQIYIWRTETAAPTVIHKQTDKYGALMRQTAVENARRRQQQQ